MHAQPTLPAHTESLVDLLRWRTTEQPDHTAYTFVAGDDERSWTYADLDARARQVAAALRRRCAPGDRVVLILPPGLDYVAAFFGCLYTGTIAVPVYPPQGSGLVRSLGRLAGIVADARPTVALTVDAVATQRADFARTNELLGMLDWISVDLLPPAGPDDEPMPATRDDLAFLQYTSGSTGAPKGVMVSHGNLLHNGADIERFFGLTPTSKSVIWLPPYHDMGLIGGILQPLYTGYQTVLMSPTEFARRPLRWLRAIADHRASVSGGPNFAYELCVRKITPDQLVGLDLSCWTVAFNGAEPVRADVMTAFAELVADTGFRPEAFHPCYGLAEATLIVTGGSPKSGPVLRQPDDPAREPIVGCGRPAPGQRLAIVDPDTRLRRPDGEVGEIWVAGPSVARGYWQQPAATAETFHGRIADTDDGPYLRTGDLGRVLDGDLYVTGRIKDLIIQNGVNHYPQDLEYSAFRAHPALRPNGGACFSVVVDGRERLVVTHEADRPNRAADVDEIAAAVRAALGTEHLVQPYAFVLVKPGRLPRTSSGKIQRHAARAQYAEGTLPALAARTFAGPDPVGSASSATLGEPATGVAGPPGSVEEFLRERIASRTGVAPAALDLGLPGPALGLDSLGMLELQHEVEQAFGVPVELEAWHDTPVAELSAAVTARRSAVRESTTGSSVEPDALTPGERGLWYLDRITGCGAAYNMAGAVRLPVDVDHDALRRAVEALARRHPALRTSLPLRDGQPVRHVAAEPELQLTVEPPVDRSPQALTEHLAELVAEPFDLTTGPLIRVRLVTGQLSGPVLLVVMHHVIGDFWSMSLLVDELARCYAADRRGIDPALPPAGGYSDFVARQREYLDGPTGTASAEFWRQQLGGRLPVLDLPTDRPRPPVQTYRGDCHDFVLAPELLDRLVALARSQGTTLYTTLLCAFQVLLYRYSGQTDILVATPTFGRSSPSLVNTVGYLVNPVVMRGDLGGAPTFRDLLGRLSNTVAAALRHQDYPFGLVAEQVQAVRDPARSPVFQVMFIHHQTPSRLPDGFGSVAVGHATRPFTIDGLRLEPVAVPQRTAQFDLTMIVAEDPDGLVARIQFNADLFDRSSIADLADNFGTLVREITGDPDRAIEELPLLDVAKRERMVRGWNDTAVVGPPERCIHEVIATAGAPDAVAVAFRSTRLSYAELTERSDRLARELADHGVGPETRVALCLDRSPELIIAMLGILKAGGAYVPLDPTHPRARIDMVIADARPALVITRRPVSDVVAEAGVPLLDIDEVLATPDRRVGGVSSGVRPDNAAYLLYTSGSTGVPKGVVVSHRNVGNFFLAMDERVGCGPDDTMLAVTNVGFDISVLELLWTLARGARVVLAEETFRQRAVAARSRPVDFSLFYFASTDTAAEPTTDRYGLVFEGARFADAHGFAAIWTPERHFHEFGGLYPNPSVLSAAVAALTGNIAVRAGSVVLPLHSPVRVAEEWALVDNISGGRVGVAFASGWHADDFVFFPERYPDRKERMFQDIETVHRLWRGEAVSLPGGSGTPVQVRIHPAPIQPALPTWITAAGSPETFSRAGALGANVLTHLLGQSVEQVAGNIRRYREARAAHGHDPAGGTVTLMLHTFLGEDSAAVRDAVREPFTRYLRSSVGLIENLVRSLQLPVDLAGMSETDLDDLLNFAFNRYYDTSALFGTPDAVRPLVDRCVEAGVDEIACLVDFGLPRDQVLAGLPLLARVREQTNLALAEPTAATLAEQVAQWQPTLLQATPSAMQMITLDDAAMAQLTCLRALLVGGEALPPALAARLRRDLPARLFNMYGPTETTVWSAVHEVTEVAGAVPLGRPVANTQIYLVDEMMRLVPRGVPGELVIGGAGVSRGYWGRPAVTAERFVPDPFGTVPGGRLYRTGDLARYGSDGRLEFLGRLDRQVKVRGHRIELGDIEAALTARPDIREAAVVARPDAGGGVGLLAYVVAADDARPTDREVRRDLRDRLPQPLIPMGVVVLPDLPRTVNGKVDTAALAAREWSAAGGGGQAAPVTDLERDIAAVWSEVLQVDSVGLHDNFFDLGGHSILMVQVHDRLQRTVGGDLPLIKLLEHPTVSSLAAYLSDTGTSRRVAAFSASAERAHRQRDSRRRPRRAGGRDRA
ncbi:LLM class flavin-dependent oxidoreductase [Micromonospora sp. FIMYZ51]|uniref:MupA/Atu3671 family FMN-dependent luciferase-like monooxygenase n=1 Tax=Micromonospora sp. FIMYZ51 TaxID=3051832 RepID=UPI00311E4C89